MQKGATALHMVPKFIKCNPDFFKLNLISELLFISRQDFQKQLVLRRELIWMACVRSRPACEVCGAIFSTMEAIMHTMEAPDGRNKTIPDGGVAPHYFLRLD